MKAVSLNQYGASSVLQIVEMALPTYEAGQVLIKIKASGLNLIDTKMRIGYVAEMMPKSFPLILGWEASGTVTAIGSGVKNFKPGDEVYAHINMMQGGTYAEFVAVNENEIAHKPKTLSHVHAATVPMAANTAYKGLVKIACIKKGQRILIHGAAGGVGSYAVQIAKLKGAYVIGTATGNGIELVKTLGADEVIDYTTTDFTTAVKEVDIVLDVIGGETQIKSFWVLKKGGLLLTTVPPEPSAAMAKKYGINAQFFYTEPDGAVLAQLAKWIEEGKLKALEPIVISLSEAAKAHEMLETRTAHGKLVFEML